MQRWNFPEISSKDNAFVRGSSCLEDRDVLFGTNPALSTRWINFENFCVTFPAVLHPEPWVSDLEPGAIVGLYERPPVQLEDAQRAKYQGYCNRYQDLEFVVEDIVLMKSTVL